MELRRLRPDREVRCRHCGTLLGKLDPAGLTIRRGDLQVTLDGDFRAAFVCHRPSCRSLNVLQLSTERTSARAG